MVRKPEEMIASFQRLFNAGDAAGLIGLYEEDALVVHPDGRELRGKAAIREMLDGLVATGMKITIANEWCRLCGDLALSRAKWKLAGKDAEGKPTEMTGVSSELMRRQKDGGWLYAIDAPTGGG